MSAALGVPAAIGRVGDAQLFETHALRLQAVVSRQVHTSAANVEDACGFAWLQLISHRPRHSSAFGWLCATAIREAMKLHRRTSHLVDLEQVADVAADARHEPECRLELIGAAEAIRQARLRPREARLLGLRVAGYSRAHIAECTGDSRRTVDRQLGRAHGKLRDARRSDATAG